MTDPERPRTTPEGHTPEEPRPSELGKRGSPGAGMTADMPHAADARAVESGDAQAADEPIGDAHGTDAHGTDAPAADHAHVEPRLGPIDWPAWTYAVVGAALGLLVVATFYIAIA